MIILIVVGWWKEKGGWEGRGDNGLMVVLCCVIGLIGGVAVSTFSKTLALLFGLVVFGVQVSAIGISIWEQGVVES